MAKVPNLQGVREKHLTHEICQRKFGRKQGAPLFGILSVVNSYVVKQISGLEDLATKLFSSRRFLNERSPT